MSPAHPQPASVLGRPYWILPRPGADRLGVFLHGWGMGVVADEVPAWLPESWRTPFSQASGLAELPLALAFPTSDNRRRGWNTRPRDTAYVAAVLEDAARRLALDPATALLGGFSDGSATAAATVEVLAGRLGGLVLASGGLGRPRPRLPGRFPVVGLMGDGQGQDGGVSNAIERRQQAKVVAALRCCRATGHKTQSWMAPRSGHRWPAELNVAWCAWLLAQAAAP